MIDRWAKARGRNVSIALVAEYWCLYCLRCDAPEHDTIRRDKQPTPRYSGGDPAALCTNPNEHQRYITFCDMGEPECLSCGQFLGETPLVVDSIGFGGIRAHIVPWSITQDSRPENVCPLCEACHKANPELKQRRVYLDWLCGRIDIKIANWEQSMRELHDAFPDGKLVTEINDLMLMSVLYHEASKRPAIEYNPLWPFRDRGFIRNLEAVVIDYRTSPDKYLAIAEDWREKARQSWGEVCSK